MLQTNSTSHLNTNSYVDWEDISNAVTRHGVFFQGDRKVVYSGKNILNCRDNKLTDLGYTGTASELFHELEEGIYNYWNTYPADIENISDRAEYLHGFVNEYADYKSSTFGSNDE